MASRPPDLGQTWTDDRPTPSPASERVAPERYELRRELGRGGMGRVVLAWDTVLQREVAIKVLLAGRGQDAFLREARIAARLEHPSIVPVHDAGSTPDGEVFYVMRLVPGTHLGESMARATTPAERLALLDTLIDVARAVAYAHELGVVHRDLKPENVMIGPWGEVQVVDWGLARVLAEADPSLRALATDLEAGRVVGTPAYMSPEQAAGAPADARADTWALGMMLRELLTGDRPWDATTSPVDVMAAVREGRVPPLPADLPPELAAVVRRATAHDPADRYPHAGAFVADLLAFRAGRRVSAHTYTAWDEWRRFDRQFWWPVRAAGVGVVAGVVALGVVTWQFQVARRAEAAERSARTALEAAHGHLGEALTQSLLQSAREADRAGRATEALAFAAAALERAPADPDARGVVGRWVSTLPMVVDRVLGPVPGPCTSLVAGAGELLVCSGPAGTWAWDGDVRWHLPEVSGKILALDGEHLVVAADTTLVLAVRDGTTTTTLPDARAALIVGDEVVTGFFRRVERRSIVDGAVRAEATTGSQVVHLVREGDGVAAVTATGGIERFDAELTPLGTPTRFEPRLAIANAAIGPEGTGIALHPERGVSLLSMRDGTLRRVDGAANLARMIGRSPTGGAWLRDEDGFALVDGTAVGARIPAAASSGAALGADGALRLVMGEVLVRLVPGSVPAEVRFPTGIRELSLQPGGRVLAITGAGFARVIEAGTGATVDDGVFEDVVSTPSVVWLGQDRWVAAIPHRPLHEGDGLRWRPLGGAVQTSIVAWRTGWASVGDGVVSFVDGDGATIRVPVPAEGVELLSGPGDTVLLLDRADGSWLVDATGAVRALPDTRGTGRRLGSRDCGFWRARPGEVTAEFDETVRFALPPLDGDTPRVACLVRPDVLAVSTGVTIRLLARDGTELARVGPFASRVSSMVVAGDWLLVGRWSGDVGRWWIPALDRPADALAASARAASGWTATGGRLEIALPP